MFIIKNKIILFVYNRKRGLNMSKTLNKTLRQTFKKKLKRKIVKNSIIKNNYKVVAKSNCKIEV